MSTLERAIAIAAEAHAGSFDKGGAPYILHPLRVMQAVDGIEAKIVAVLHDVVEDCNPPWSLEKIRAEGFSDAVVAGLDAVTIRAGEDYMDFVRRACADPIGRKVKAADLTDNLDISRITEMTAKDYARNEKYKTALARRSQLTMRGNLPEDVVERARRTLAEFKVTSPP